MGAGIAADPLSPDFDPLIRLSEESEPRRLVSAAHSTSRRERR
jgi:hypothetical protein